MGIARTLHASGMRKVYAPRLLREFVDFGGMHTHYSMLACIFVRLLGYASQHAGGHWLAGAYLLSVVTIVVRTVPSNPPIQQEARKRMRCQRSRALQVRRRSF
jgi:hypothetical protein